MTIADMLIVTVLIVTKINTANFDFLEPSNLFVEIEKK